MVLSHEIYRRKTLTKSSSNPLALDDLSTYSPDGRVNEETPQNRTFDLELQGSWRSRNGRNSLRAFHGGTFNKDRNDAGVSGQSKNQSVHGLYLLPRGEIDHQHKKIPATGCFRELRVAGKWPCSLVVQGENTVV